MYLISTEIVFIDLLDDIDKLCEEYISKVRDLLPAERKEYFAKIENAFQKSREYGDDKVQLAVQTYEMVIWTILFKCFFIISKTLKLWQKTKI